jgi:nuclear pore complex protein Nup62
LKGKTLDEILVKWNGELDTQTKEFTRMANEVAVWDRALMENSEKVCARLRAHFPNVLASHDFVILP